MKLSASGHGINSLAQVLGGVADSVESLGFMFVFRGLLQALAENLLDGLRQRTGLFDELNEGKANEL